MTIEHDKSEIIECARLPRKKDGSIDLYKIDRLLLEIDAPNERIAILRRLLEIRVTGY